MNLQIPDPVRGSLVTVGGREFFFEAGLSLRDYRLWRERLLNEANRFRDWKSLAGSPQGTKILQATIKMTKAVVQPGEDVLSKDIQALDLAVALGFKIPILKGPPPLPNMPDRGP